MGYSVEDVRALMGRWLAGETSLAEEEALREFFGGHRELPADLQPYRPLFGQSAEAAGERSSRKLILHTDGATQRGGQRQGDSRHKPLVIRRLSGWIAVTAGVAAAALALVLTLPAPSSKSDLALVQTHPVPKSDIVCTVNGVEITDPKLIDAYTREALDMVSDNLRKSQEAVSSTLGGSKALEKAAEVLENVTLDDTKGLD